MAADLHPRYTVSLLPKMAALVIGDRNKVIAEGVITQERATAVLRSMGYVITHAWVDGLYDASSAVVARS